MKLSFKYSLSLISVWEVWKQSLAQSLLGDCPWVAAPVTASSTYGELLGRVTALLGARQKARFFWNPSPGQILKRKACQVGKWEHRKPMAGLEINSVRVYSLRFVVCKSLWEICHLCIFSMKIHSDSAESVFITLFLEKDLCCQDKS